MRRGRQGWGAVAHRAGLVVLLASVPGCDVTEPGEVAAAATVLEWVAIDLERPLNYEAIEYPRHYDGNVLARDNAPATNPVTDEGAALGRVLFFDRELSVNRTMSCASCHAQENGFTDSNVLSEGFAGELTGAHSMRLANARFYVGDEMFWDRRADSVEDQVLQPIQDPVEMGFSAEAGGLPSLLQRMEGLAYYPILFDWAFGSPAITEARLQQALAQYVRSMVSTGSRFDVAFAQAAPNGPQAPATLPGFTAEENLGFQLFVRPPDQGGAGCARCHQSPTFALDDDSRSNGLDVGETTVFKSPSLKNVAVGGPYMHDGRFGTLEEVVQHYSTGVQPGPALDRRLLNRAGQPVRPGFSPTDVAALVAFMETLTDTDLLTAERFNDPFIR